VVEQEKEDRKGSVVEAVTGTVGAYGDCGYAELMELYRYHPRKLLVKYNYYSFFIIIIIIIFSEVEGSLCTEEYTCVQFHKQFSWQFGRECGLPGDQVHRGTRQLFPQQLISKYKVRKEKKYLSCNREREL
jgi:hypothetical protein